MTDLNYLAIAAAIVAGFIVSSVWYAAFGSKLAGLSAAYADPGATPVWKVIPVELMRNLVLAVVVSGLANAIGIDGWAGAVAFGLALWVGFPVVLLTGAVFHENEPWKLAAIHAGDWLLKLIVISVIVVVWT